MNPSRRMPMYQKIEKSFVKVLLLFFCITQISCTMIGFHRDKIRREIDFGEEETLRLCVWKDVKVSEKELTELVETWNKELEYYKIRISLSDVKDWERPGWTGATIMDQVFYAELPLQCDRLLAVAGGKLSDTVFELVGIVFALFGIPSFQILGAVETKTGTRGYILGQTRTISHWLSGGAEETLIHEGYHLLGCKHSFFLSDCYVRIRTLKELKRKNREAGTPFFPSIDEEGKIFLKSPWE
ncbi:hypothetical protein LEP1GSC193_3374 [Leptospira alstonii serovar Pingchang str. 80-412]|uniref:Uncharacterized protein n=3 Tax=Leptospira alstonii TaxID=28452 RepID=M6D0W0_9LEPT|nr:hypothetical protein LEP1GSC194_3955 [Leptospira alstonii serovar Sichuan str. 79601]EQA82067.1 hypothetical protein LEP1GSC193_3374 [Leptospira alstonii serovar Pingchang str. 80-412]